jgi:hypothetical protein
MVFVSSADYLKVFNTTNKTSELYQETLRKLWADPTFTGSYSGLNNFLRSVKFDLGLNVDPVIARKSLGRMRGFSAFIRKQTKLKYRTYSLDGSFQLWQSDLAVCVQSPNGYKYIMLCIDCFRNRLHMRFCVLFNVI